MDEKNYANRQKNGRKQQRELNAACLQISATITLMTHVTYNTEYHTICKHTVQLCLRYKNLTQSRM